MPSDETALWVAASAATLQLNQRGALAPEVRHQNPILLPKLFPEK